MNKQHVDDKVAAVPMQEHFDHKPLTKSSSEPGHPHDGQGEKEKRQVTRTMTQPGGTIIYTAKSSDTLTSIAARYDTTPSELTKLNRLSSRLIFPGQVLYVPDKTAPLVDVPPTEGGTVNIKLNEVPITSQSSPKPGHVERVQSPVSSPIPPRLSEEDERILDRECIEKFLKINVRHITDGQGVVSGVLLVTPNAVMFDPNVSDPLVIEHGAEKYGVIAPMDFVVNAAMYNDIATMFVSHAPNRSMISSPEVYRSACILPRRRSAPIDSVSCRSDSEHAVNGSVSDMAEAGTPEEDRASLCSCQTPGVAALPTPDYSAGNLDSVFLDDHTSDEASLSLGLQDESVASRGATITSGSSIDSDVKLNKTGRSASDSSCTPLLNEVTSAVESNVTGQLTDNLPKEQTPASSQKGPEDRNLSPCISTQQSPSAAAAAPVEQGLKESLSRKNSSHRDGKINVLKRLSYPLAWMESFSGDKDKENAPPLSTLSEAPSAPATIPQAAQQQQQQSTLSKIFTTSPRTLVDFSLFAWSGDDPNAVKSQEGQYPNGNIPLVSVTAKGASPQEARVTSSAEQRRSSYETHTNSGAGGKKSSPNVEKRSPSEGDIKEPKVGFKSVVSVDDMPDLFASIDQLIPRPAKPCDDPPLYLCLRMGKPIDTKLLKSTPMMAYGKKRMKREYWFSIPLDRVDDLYSFFHHWAPNVYGDLDEGSIRKAGFELVAQEEELSDEEPPERHDTEGGNLRRSAGDSTPGDAHSDWEVIKAPHMKLFSRLRRDNRCDSEVVSVADVQRQMSIEVELPLPDLIGKTDILEEEHRKMLTKHLPARAVGYAWTLIFSTSQHGFSLKSLYRKMAQYETPVLLVIMDTDNSVFGALTSCTLKMSDHFYGTGESFLFSFCPEFQVYNWTGENLYFIKGNTESLAIGAGDGVFGLWLDGDLNHGRSHPCKTYNNNMLSTKEDFCVKTLEAWGFVEVDTAGL